MSDDEKILVVTMRCIDIAASCSDIDKIKCGECGEMTWLSIYWRRKNERPQKSGSCPGG